MKSLRSNGVITVTCGQQGVKMEDVVFGKSKITNLR